MKKWKPKNGEWYWAIHRILPHMHDSKDAIIATPYIWKGDTGDLSAFRYRNVFATKKQAIAAGKTMLTTLKTFQKTEEAQ